MDYRHCVLDQTSAFPTGGKDGRRVLSPALSCLELVERVAEVDHFLIAADQPVEDLAGLRQSIIVGGHADNGEDEGTSR